MMNPKAIVTKRKKKLRSCSMEFNKKTGQYEFQIKESGRIIVRENVEDMRTRMEEDLAKDTSDYTPHRVSPEEIEESAKKIRAIDNQYTQDTED